MNVSCSCPFVLLKLNRDQIVFLAAQPQFHGMVDAALPVGIRMGIRKMVVMTMLLLRKQAPVRDTIIGITEYPIPLKLPTMQSIRPHRK